MQNLQDQFPIAWLSRRLNVARSAYYAWLHRQQNPASRTRDDEEIAGVIEELFHAHHGRYGAPRIHQELRARGRHHGRKRVERLMRCRGLQARRRKRFRPCTARSDGTNVAANVLDRQFAPSAPNRRWAGDITYVRTTQGWRYLAIWMDLFSRRIVGWTLGSSLEGTLVIEALHRALGQRQVNPDALLIHTDRGSQYTASEYQDLLKKEKIECSMSGKGNCWDNAVVESFFSTYKLENDLDGNSPNLLTPWELQRKSAYWIEGYYNRERRHSFLEYLSPIEYEERAQRARMMCERRA